MTIFSLTNKAAANGSIQRSFHYLPRALRGYERQRCKGRSDMKPFDVRECCCCRRGVQCPCGSPMGLQWGSSSLCDSRSGDDEGRHLRTLSRCSFPPRSRKNSPSVRRASSAKRSVWCSEMDFGKMKRSLRLLGFEPSDMGMYSEEEERSGRRKDEKRRGSFRTRVVKRSVSLEELRESVRRAWADERFDESHRRLLSQAAYEEWYFRKERELWEKQKEERIKRAEAAGCLQEEVKRRKEKSEEEFKKWLQKKKGKKKEGREEHLGRQSVNTFKSLVKTEEEIKEAFLKWKKAKDEELEKRRKEKKQAEEQQKASERQKAEKKATAEKAFLQWKRQVEEKERLEEEKRRRRIQRHEEIQKRRQGERAKSAISFQIWKQAKDMEMKQRNRQLREADREAREQRLAQMEERMYQADQAFEDWLDSLDNRKQKHLSNPSSYEKPIPWIPA